MEGWIKLHRKIIDDPVFDNEKGLKVWLWCLLKASHKDYVAIVGRQNVKLIPGQFVFGRQVAAEETGLSPTTIYFWIQFLERNKYIDIKTTNKYSVISILNWKRYQDIDSKWTANGQQMDTYKNDKNVKNILYKDKSKKKSSKKGERASLKSMKEVFDYWNSKEIVQHRVLTDQIKDTINARLTTEKYTIKELKRAMDNYHFILGDDRFWLSYRWTLVEFLRRGLEKMLNLDAAKRMYLKEGESLDKSKEGYADIKADNPAFLD